MVSLPESALGSLGIAALTIITAAAMSPTARLQRRTRRYPIALTVITIAVCFAMTFYLKEPTRIGVSILFAATCGSAAASATLDILIGRVRDTCSSAIAVSGALAAYLSGTLPASLLATLMSVGILLVARRLASSRTQTPGIGWGDILFAGACGIWIAPGMLPIALLAATVITACLTFTGPGRPRRRMPFAPGIAAGYGAVLLLQGYATIPG